MLGIIVTTRRGHELASYVNRRHGYRRLSTYANTLAARNRWHTGLPVAGRTRYAKSCRLPRRTYGSTVAGLLALWLLPRWSNINRTLPDTALRYASIEVRCLVLSGTDVIRNGDEATHGEPIMTHYETAASPAHASLAAGARQSTPYLSSHTGRQHCLAVTRHYHVNTPTTAPNTLTIGINIYQVVCRMRAWLFGETTRCWSSCLATSLIMVPSPRLVTPYHTHQYRALMV